MHVSAYVSRNYAHIFKNIIKQKDVEKAQSRNPGCLAKQK